MSIAPGNDSVQELAQNIARQIAARQAVGGSPLTPGNTINGSFTLAVKYGTNTYNLTVSIPTGTGDVYEFSLTELPDSSTDPAKDTKDLVVFKYLDKSDWEVVVSLPKAVNFGSISIESLSLTIKDGTVPVPPSS